MVRFANVTIEDAHKCTARAVRTKGREIISGSCGQRHRRSFSLRKAVLVRFGRCTRLRSRYKIHYSPKFPKRFRRFFRSLSNEIFRHAAFRTANFVTAARYVYTGGPYARRQERRTYIYIYKFDFRRIVLPLFSQMRRHGVAIGTIIRAWSFARWNRRIEVSQSKNAARFTPIHTDTAVIEFAVETFRRLNFAHWTARLSNNTVFFSCTLSPLSGHPVNYFYILAGDRQWGWWRPSISNTLARVSSPHIADNFTVTKCTERVTSFK